MGVLSGENWGHGPHHSGVSYCGQTKSLGWGTLGMNCIYHPGL